MSISVDLSEVPRLLQLLLSLNLFDQEAEAKETEQLNPDVVSSLKKEITANWSQPRLQKVLFQYILYTIYYILYSSHSMRLRLSTQSLNAHINKVWEGVVKRLERRLEKIAEEGTDFIPVTSLRSGRESGLSGRLELHLTWVTSRAIEGAGGRLPSRVADKVSRLVESLGLETPQTARKVAK